MKSFLLIASTVACLFAFSSCERCTTCTFDDGSEVITDDEVCASGRTYSEVVEDYENAGWTCEE